MSRRAAEMFEGFSLEMMEQVASPASAMATDDRLALLARLRQNANGEAALIDRFFVERVTRLGSALAMAEEQQEKIRELLDTLAGPPHFPAVYLSAAHLPGIDGALVQCGEERRVVRIGDEVDADALRPGDEVYLTHERNCLVARSEAETFPAGEVASYDRTTSDGRIILRQHDQEIVAMPRPSLRDAGLKSGDGVRFHRSAGVALEKVERPRGEGYFLESTPSDTFLDIGGLDSEIEKLKNTLSLHIFNADATKRYRVPPKNSVLIEGPPGNGKTKVARALANWLAQLSPGGRSRFIGIKPAEFNSMWFGQTEERWRELFRVAREAAAADPAPVVIFLDEIDSIGGIRGAESSHRIDDRILSVLLAELNGLEHRQGIFILSATNRLDALDPALLRPGRLGDLVLHFHRPRSKGARQILSCHLPSDIPYACNGEGPLAAREALLDLAVAQLYAHGPETELARITLRDGKHRMVSASDLVSGAHLEAIAQAALERACVRETEGGPAGVAASDIDSAVCGFFHSAARALTPRNARSYLQDLPQDTDAVSVDLVERKVRQPYRYRVEVV